jgi:mono/diheme cytochrome c family protein
MNRTPASRLLSSALACLAMHSLPSVAVTNPSEEGRRLYHAACAMCHGAELKAAGGIPDLRRTGLDDKAFQAVVKEGRAGTIMPSMKARLSDEEIRKIRAYVRSAASE